MSDEGIAAIAETLERHLRDFLVPDWLQKGQIYQEQAEQLAATIKRRA